jgi:hypothetical protein
MHFARLWQDRLIPEETFIFTDNGVARPIPLNQFSQKCAADYSSLFRTAISALHDIHIHRLLLQQLQKQAESTVAVGLSMPPSELEES